MLRSFRRVGNWVVALCLATGLEVPSADAATWLPGETLVWRNPSDPGEPRFGLSYAPDPDQLDASLGAPLPIVSFSAGRTPVLFLLEAGVFMRLGRDGSFFPLRTVDGLFGLGVETRRNRIAARLRLLHQSAHKADGDSTLTYPGDTFSREFWQLEASLLLGRSWVYLRTGSAWHAVPERKGLELAMGGVWRGPGDSGRPLLSVHLEAADHDAWKLTKSVLAAWEAGRSRRFTAGLRFFDGLVPHGQYFDVSERFVGVEIQFTHIDSVFPGD